MSGQSFTLDSRRKKFALLSQELTSLQDSQLHKITPRGEKQSAWGTTELFEVSGETVFVKRIPLTELECNNMLSTRNLYDLPTFFNYGIGSIGLSIFRELAANIKSTEWVLSGEHPYFPLMYHYRVLPITGDHRKPDQEADQSYIDYWAGNKNIERYVRDRCEATYELVLCLEYFPIELDSWISQNPSQVQVAVDALFRTSDFLRDKGLIHFDAHFQNVMTDGENMYLTDFGLVLDNDFELSEVEKAFFDSHSHFDYARIVACLGFHLGDRYRALSEPEQLDLKSQFDLPAELSDREASYALISKAEHLAGHGLELDHSYLGVLLKYRDVYACIYEFSMALIKSKDKDAQFPREEIRRLLAKAGII